MIIELIGVVSAPKVEIRHPSNVVTHGIEEFPAFVPCFDYAVCIERQ